MNFRFDVTITDEDYFDFNKFWMLRSHYGKKQTIFLRAVIVLFFTVFIAVNLKDGGFNSESVVVSVFALVMLVLSQVLFSSIYGAFLKSHLKSLKKKGKMAFSPTSVIEFYDDYFVETTPLNKNEQKYSSIERVCFVDNKVVYIYVNNIMAYILPVASFKSKEEYDSFFEFIKTKCSAVEIY